MQNDSPELTQNWMSLSPSLEEITKHHLEKADALLDSYKDVREAQNRLPQAIDEYIKASELDESPAILLKLAKAYMLNGQYNTARKLLNKVKQDNRLSIALKINAAEVDAYLLFRHGCFEDAKAVLKQAFGMERPWRTGRLFMSLATIEGEMLRECSTQKEWLSFLFHLATATTLYAVTEPKIFTRPMFKILGTMVTNRFRTTDQSLAAYIRLYQEFPGLDALHLQIGMMYQKLEHYTEAEFWYSRMISRHPSRDDGYRVLTSLYRTTNNLEQLTSTLRQWLEIRPNSGEIMTLLSQALAQTPEHLEEAIRLAKQAIMALKEPALIANTYAHMGNIYGAMQMIDCATMAYQSAVSLNPNNLDYYVQLGTLYYDRQEFMLSQRIFDQALKLSPDNARILCNLGYLAWMQGNINEALSYYHRSVELDPTYDIALNNLGVLYLDHVGQIETAMALFDQTLLHHPNYALCYYNKGRANSFLGHTIEAARCFQQAQELNEQSNELDSRELAERIMQLFDNSEQTPSTDS